MRVLVTGGSGVLGRHVTAGLIERGHRVTVASRRPRSIDGAATAVLDLQTGQGLEAVAGHDTIVHLASDPFHSTEVDVDGTARLLEAARRQGVSHVLAISIVGVDDHPYPYYRAKLAMEARVRDSGVPWTILRATQFHELIPRFIDQLPNVGIIPFPRGVQIQPVHETVAAARLVQLVEDGPGGRVADLGGPEVLDGRSMVRSYLDARHLTRLILPVPLFGKWARAFRGGQMLTDRTPGPTYAEHIASIRPAPRDPIATTMRIAAIALTVLAVWMMVTPDSFHRIVAPYGTPNQHLFRDLGTFNVPLVIGLWMAASRPLWRRPVLAIVMVQNGLHLGNHILDVTATDPVMIGVMNALLLAAFQLVLWRLWSRSRVEEVSPSLA